MASPVIVTTRQTHRPIVEAHDHRGLSAQARPMRLTRMVLRYFVGCRDRLDLQAASDIVKRDLGFLDGCAPYREEDRMR